MISVGSTPVDDGRKLVSSQVEHHCDAAGYKADGRSVMTWHSKSSFEKKYLTP
jgi:hypothetical protein